LWLNNQRGYGTIDAMGGFRALNWSKPDPPPARLSDCKLGMLYKVINKIPAEFGTFLLVAQQPEVLWQNGAYSLIQLVK